MIKEVTPTDKALEGLIRWAMSHPQSRKSALTIDASRVLKSWQARCRAVKLLEQAESKFIDGPLRLKNQLTRFATIDIDRPVAAYRCSVSGS